MKSVLEQVLADLVAEGDRVEALVASLDENAWRTRTPAVGWTVAHQVGHLAWTDDAALLSATDPDGWAGLLERGASDPGTFVDEAAEELASMAPAELLDRWREGRTRLATVLREHPAGERLAWFGPPMSPTSMATARLMETWAHGLDVADALGATYQPDERLRHIAHLGVRTRDFAFVTHGEQPPGEEFAITLVTPDDEVWNWGPPDAAQGVTGPAYDFCLLVTQRRNRSDLALEAVGPDADHWLDIAQAFAGPPGNGRPPT